MLFPKMPSILDDSILEYSPDKDPQTILLEEYFGWKLSLINKVFPSLFISGSAQTSDIDNRKTRIIFMNQLIWRFKNFRLYH